MPNYSFKCDRCDKGSVKKTSISQRDIPLPCDCGGNLKRLILPSAKTTVMDLNDDFYHNKPVRKDIQKTLKKRSRDYAIKNIGESIEKHGLKNVGKTSLLGKNGKKRTIWDDI